MQGTEIDDGDYSHLNVFMKYSIIIFRNSIGGDATPKYTHWALLYTYKNGKYYTYANLMIGYSWVLWMMNAFFTMIILMNYLIAIISQSYDSVMAN